MDVFGFHPELFQVRANVLSTLHDAGFQWPSHFSAVDPLHDVYGVEICGIVEEHDASTMVSLLRRMFPNWLISRPSYKDYGREPGFKVRACRDKPRKREQWRTPKRPQTHCSSPLLYMDSILAVRTPLVNGYYRSHLVEGVTFVRFLQFFSTRFWLLADTTDCEFDFPGLVINLNVVEMQKDPNLVVRELVRVGGHAVKCGNFHMICNEIFFSCQSPSAETSFESPVYVLDEGRKLRAGNWEFSWLPLPGP